MSIAALGHRKTLYRATQSNAHFNILHRWTDVSQLDEVVFVVRTKVYIPDDVGSQAKRTKQQHRLFEHWLRYVIKQPWSRGCPQYESTPKCDDKWKFTSLIAAKVLRQAVQAIKLHLTPL